MNCYLYNDVNVCNCDEGFEMVTVKNITDSTIDYQICQGNFIDI